MANEYFTLYFRVGGTSRFAWKRTIPFIRDEAGAKLDEIKRQGYAAFLLPFDFGNARDRDDWVPREYEPPALMVPALMTNMAYLRKAWTRMPSVNYIVITAMQETYAADHWNLIGFASRD